MLAFLRISAHGRPLACIANLSPVPRREYRIGLPRGGVWQELLNTDRTAFAGGGVGNGERITARDEGWHGLPASVDLTLPPLAVLWLVPSQEPVQP